MKGLRWRNEIDPVSCTCPCAVVVVGEVTVSGDKGKGGGMSWKI